jgi:hypothetical protein
LRKAGNRRELRLHLRLHLRQRAEIDAVALELVAGGDLVGRMPVRLPGETIGEWLDAAGITKTKGALFRQCRKTASQSAAGSASIFDVIKNGIARIGPTRGGSHSMRLSWISTAARNGTSDDE